MLFSRLHQWRYVGFLLTKCLSAAEERCSRYSVNSNTHWASGCLWCLISFDCLILCPWEQLSQSILAMARYQWGRLEVPAGRLLQLSPEQLHQPRTSFNPPAQTDSWHWPNAKCLGCPCTQGWLRGMLRGTKSNCAASVLEERLRLPLFQP